MRADEIRRLQKRFDDLSREITVLETELEKASPKLRETYEGEIRELEARKRTAGDNLAKLRLQNAESWTEQDVQKGIIRVFDDIGRRLERLFGDIGKRRPQA